MQRNSSKKNMRSEHTRSRRGDQGTIDAWTLIFLLWDNAFLIVVSTLLGVTAALAYLRWTPPVYAARARLEIASNEQVLPDMQRQSSEDVSSASLLKTVEQTIASNTVLARVVAEGHLANDPDFVRPGENPTEVALIERLRGRISVNLIRGTRLIALELTASDPAKARHLLQSLLDNFFSQTVESRKRVSVSAREFLVAEAARLAEKLGETELQLQQYREKHDAMAITDRQNLVIDRLRHLHTQLSDARNARLTLESEQVQVTAALDSGSLDELLNLQGIAARPEVIELRKQLDALNTKVAAYALPYGDNHPVLKQARRQRDETDNLLRQTVLSVAESILRHYNAAKSTEELLQRELAVQEQTAVALDRVAIPYHALERELQSDAALHAQVLKRLKETDITQNLIAAHNFSDSYVHVAEKPFAPPAPVRPLWKWALVVGVLGGGLLGCGLVAFRCVLDDSVSSVSAVEACLGVATLAVIPRSKQLGFRHGRVKPPGPDSPEIEPFRLLRTSLSLRQDTARHQAMMFTSACPGEGKTCCAVNYAAVVAQSGLRTLLIDGDLRRPKLRKAFQRFAKRTTLTECIKDPGQLGTAIDHTGIGNLFLLSNPVGTSHAAELLASHNLPVVLEKCLELFDRVIIDTAPVAVVSDALCFARYVPTVCLVVHAGHTSRRLVRRAHTLITEVAGRPLAGVVLNQIRNERAATYGYYYQPTGSLTNDIASAPAAG